MEILPGINRKQIFPLLILAAWLFPRQTFPPAASDFAWRVAHRRNVSHILFERRGGENTLTILISHPRHWAFHADSHPLYYPCGTPGQCLAWLRRLDRHLDRGWSIRLKLHGSRISEIETLEP